MSFKDPLHCVPQDAQKSSLILLDFRNNAVDAPLKHSQELSVRYTMFVQYNLFEDFIPNGQFLSTMWSICIFKITSKYVPCCTYLLKDANTDTNCTLIALELQQLKLTLSLEKY